MAGKSDDDVSICLIGERVRRGAPVKARFVVVSKKVSEHFYAGVVVGQVDLDILVNEPFWLLFDGPKVASAVIGWKDYVGNKERDSDEVREDCRAAVDVCTERLAGLVTIDEENGTCTVSGEALPLGSFNAKEVFVVREGENLRLVDALAPLLKVVIRGEARLSTFVI